MNGLPPLAKNEDVEIVLNTCQKRRALVSRSNNRRTERLLFETWHTNFARLQTAVVEHIEMNRKVFQKFGYDGRILNGFLQASVTIYSGLDIYVEMQIKGSHLVILAAHSHYTSLRLPQ